MQVRVFTAPRLHEALALVRQELGPDAVILDRQQTNSGQGDKLWHVHAALDSQPEQAPLAEPKINGGRRMDAAMHRLERIVEGLGMRETESLRSALRHPKTQAAFDHLLEIGVAPNHAFDMAGDFVENGRIGEHSMLWARRIDPARQQESIVFTGPPGSGKTTLIAKLATHYSLQGIRVALLSTDTVRIGGLDALGTYAQTLGIPFLPVHKTEELAGLATRTNSAQLLLVDSEGWSPRRNSSLRRQLALWKAIKPTRQTLVLPANMDEEDGMQILAQLDNIGTSHLALTRLDETRRPGKIVNWAVAAGLPLSFCSFGPDVPEKMGWLTPQALSSLLHRQETVAHEVAA